MVDEKTYRIGEVAEMLNLKTHVLRFWEGVFPQIAPLRTDKGQRLYTESDVAVLRRIQQLLHEQGMTIGGAKRVLEGGVDPEFMSMLVSELEDICKLLSNPNQQ